MKMLNYLTIIFSVIIIGCGNGDNENTLEATGTIEATNITLSAKVPGEIKSFNFTEGAKVNKGDTILIIDDEDLQLQLLQAKSNLEMAESQYQLLKTGARKEDIASAKAMLNQAKINMENAGRDFERMQNLYEAKSITKKQFEDVKARYEVAKEQYKATKENYQKIKNIARPEELQQASVRVNQARINIEMIEKKIRDSYVTSPINGFIVKKYFEEGETVSPMSSLVQVSDLSTVKLLIYIPEKKLGMIKPGDKAEISTDTFENKIYDGKVVYISPEAEFTPKNIQTKDERTKLVFEVKIEIPNPDNELKAGMPADAVVHF